MHWWWNDGWSWWNWALMTIGMVAFWGLVASAFVAVVRSPDRSPADKRRSPERILAERFAAGEIDSDEYHQRLEALRSTKVTAR
jgi:putative membrane protein